MPIYTDKGPISYEEFGFDNYLRNRAAPSLLNENFTVKEARMGGEMIYEPGNVFPRAISRENLSSDSLLLILPAGIQPVQFATGYCSELNDYIFGPTWDGINYILYRLNTRNLMAPFCDGKSINIPTVNGVYGCGVTEEKILVPINKTFNLGTKNLVAVYDFNLNWQQNLESVSYKEIETINKKITYDGKYVCLFRSYNDFQNVRLISQVTQTGWQPLTGNEYQTFNSKEMIQITKIRVYINNQSGYSENIYLQIRDSTGGTTLWSGSYWLTVGGASWIEYTPNLNVSQNTVYRLYVWGNYAGTYWGYATGNPYPDGESSWNSNADATMEIFGNFSAPTNGRVERYKLNLSAGNYQLEQTFNFPSGHSPPNNLLAFDGNFFYGYNETDKKIIKFKIMDDGTIKVADELPILETVNGMLNFNNFIFICYTYGNQSVAVPVSI